MTDAQFDELIAKLDEQHRTLILILENVAAMNPVLQQQLANIRAAAPRDTDDD